MKLGLTVLMLAGAVGTGSWLTASGPGAPWAYAPGWMLLDTAKARAPVADEAQRRLRIGVSAGCRGWRDCRITQVVRMEGPR